MLLWRVEGVDSRSRKCEQDLYLPVRCGRQNAERLSARARGDKNCTSPGLAPTDDKPSAVCKHIVAVISQVSEDNKGEIHNWCGKSNS